MILDSKLKAPLHSKEKDIESFFKQSSKTVSDFDIKTEEMVQLLRSTRDEQVVF